jgi:hypothetical protein
VDQSAGKGLSAGAKAEVDEESTLRRRLSNGFDEKLLVFQAKQNVLE